MKKRQVSGWLVAALLAAFVSSAVAQSGAAYSSSAVGVIRKSVAANRRVLLSVPLDQEPIEDESTGQVSPGFKFGSIPAFANLPNKSAVYFWDSDSQTWEYGAKTRGSWGSFSNHIVVPGESFFVVSPEDTELLISGDVPASTNMYRAIVGKNDTTSTSPWTFVANPYPVPMAFSNFSFSATLENKSVAYFWNSEAGTGGEWEYFPKTRGSWGTAGARMVQPGEGFVVAPANADGFVWTEAKPYTWSD